MAYDATKEETHGSFSAMQGLTPEQNRARYEAQVLASTPNQDLVRHFHRTKGFDVNDQVTQRTWKQMMFRDDLIMEECDELRHELGKASYDINKIAHEAADLLYVLYGLAVECGFDLDAVFREVHRANMTKGPSVGGKATKGEGFVPAEVRVDG